MIDANFLNAWQRMSTYDESFGSGFLSRCTVDYHKLILALPHLTLSSVQYPGSSIRGFHFTPIEIDTIHPYEGKLYLFPERPTRRDLQEIAVPIATSSGFAKRTQTIQPTHPVVIFCYEIHPGTEAEKTQVGVSMNANSGSSGLKGIEVSALDDLEWRIMDRKRIIVDKGIATLV